jgi:DNA-binding protein H-NS
LSNCQIKLVKATATKYTLVGKINVEEGAKLAKDLLHGCELVATGALVICEDNVGCSRSARHYAKQASRAILATTLELVKVFADPSILEGNEQLGAQKTGAVWSTCDALLKVPKGNRASMRRDLFTWTIECNETLGEFTEMIQLGPVDDEETGDDDFGGDQYTAEELPIVQAALALIKCSRGSMNVTLKACEAAGVAACENAEEGLLEWIATLHNLARVVGEGMTDLGTGLYPPLELIVDANDGEHLITQLVMQRDAIVELQDFCLEATFDLPEDITELASKLRSVAQKRYEEANDAISETLKTKKDDK